MYEDDLKAKLEKAESELVLLRSSDPFLEMFGDTPLNLLSMASLVLQRFRCGGLGCYTTYDDSSVKLKIEFDCFEMLKENTLTDYEMAFHTVIVKFCDGSDGNYDHAQIFFIYDSNYNSSGNFTLGPDDTVEYASVCSSLPNFADMVYDKCVEIASTVNAAWVDKYLGKIKIAPGNWESSGDSLLPTDLIYSTLSSAAFNIKIKDTPTGNGD